MDLVIESFHCIKTMSIIILEGLLHFPVRRSSITQLDIMGGDVVTFMIR